MKFHINWPLGVTLNIKHESSSFHTVGKTQKKNFFLKTFQIELVSEYSSHHLKACLKTVYEVNCVKGLWSQEVNNYQKYIFGSST